MLQVDNGSSCCRVIPCQSIDHKADHERKIDVLILCERIGQSLEDTGELGISGGDGGHGEKFVVQDLPGVRELPYGIEVAVSARARAQSLQAESRITGNDVELQTILIENVELPINGIHFPEHVLAIAVNRADIHRSEDVGSDAHFCEGLRH